MAPTQALLRTCLATAFVAAAVGPAACADPSAEPQIGPAPGYHLPGPADITAGWAARMDAGETPTRINADFDGDGERDIATYWLPADPPEDNLGGWRVVVYLRRGDAYEPVIVEPFAPEVPPQSTALFLRPAGPVPPCCDDDRETLMIGTDMLGFTIAGLAAWVAVFDPEDGTFRHYQIGG